MRMDPVVPGTDDLGPVVARARAGDRRALEEVLRASYDRVYPVCRRVLGNESDAADAAQEALISVVRGLARFDGRSRYTTWLYRIALNAAIDELRRRGRRSMSLLPADAGPDAGLLFSDGDELVGRLDLEAAVRRLPLDFRAAVVLRDVCGLDYAEIAVVLAIPAGTVRSRIARGRQLLIPHLATGEEAP
jgi:RNA polymerase sigma-70 factor (ECF subfamily)